MKQVIRYRFLTIPNKIRCEINTTVDDRTIYKSSSDGRSVLSCTPFSYVTISIVRPLERDDNGNVVSSFNRNDILSISRYNFPLFLDELNAIHKDLKIPELYKYIDKRLELDEEIAGKIRRVIKLADTVIEFSAVVIEQDSDTNPRVEGIKLKFNNEHSSVALTVNDIAVLTHVLNHLDVDTIVLKMLSMHMNEPGRNTFRQRDMDAPIVDIVPK